MTPVAHPSSMQQFVRYARLTGIPLEDILDRELWSIVQSSATRETVPAHAMVDIMQICAIMANRPEIGVAFASWCNLNGYGPLSLLWGHCPTVGETIRVSNRFLHLESDALGVRSIETEDEVALVQFVTIPTRFGGSQFVEATLSLQVRILRLVLGADWSPVRVEFDHPPPGNLNLHRTFFRCPTVFGADRSAVVIRREEMKHPNPNGNAHLLAYLERQLAATMRPSVRDFVRQVEELVAAHLAGGQATLERTAAPLRLGGRSLQRRLAAHGMTFGDVITNVRLRVAREYFALEAQPNLSELAHRLGYGEASAASRFLRRHMDSGVRAQILRGKAIRAQL